VKRQPPITQQVLVEEGCLTSVLALIVLAVSLLSLVVALVA